MEQIQHRDAGLHAEELPIADVAARFGIACYLYSRATPVRHSKSLEAFYQGESVLP